MSNLHRFGQKLPILGEHVYVAPGVQLVGEVRVGKGSSIWFNSVLRGDINKVEIGEFTNIQDLSLCHVADDFACVVGNFVTVGHKAILHACTISDEVLIGMGSTVMDGVEVGAQSIIGANSLVTKNTKIPEGSMVFGNPSRIVRTLTETERKSLRGWALKYHRIASLYLGLTPLLQ